MKKRSINSNLIRNTLRQYISEQDMPVKDEMVEKKPRCLTTNSLPLTELTGEAENFTEYTPSITKRKNGVNSLVDTLGILNNLRLFKDVNDGGEHLSYEMLQNLNNYRNRNYFDETSGQCNKAMDKVIELYKENEHGTELVKDIEKVLSLQTKDDELTPSPRAKEYLKRCMELVKGK
jgi:hypothetical protein